MKSGQMVGPKLPYCLNVHFFQVPNTFILTVLKSTLLNTLSLVAIYAFDMLLVPLLGLSRSQIDMDEFSQPEHWLRRNVGVFYKLLFQVPVVVGALYLNVSISHKSEAHLLICGWCSSRFNLNSQSSWSAVVAKRIYSLQHGRTTNTASSFSAPGSSHDR